MNANDIAMKIIRLLDSECGGLGNIDLISDILAMTISSHMYATYKQTGIQEIKWITTTGIEGYITIGKHKDMS